MAQTGCSWPCRVLDPITVASNLSGFKQSPFMFIHRCTAGKQSSISSNDGRFISIESDMRPHIISAMSEVDFVPATGVMWSVILAYLR